MIYSIDNYPYINLKDVKCATRPRGKQYTKIKKDIKDIVCAFDIEATNLDDIEQAFMYVWQFAIGKDVIIGRYWDEFITCLHNIIDVLDDTEYLVIYVHNLSYEFSFLKGIYDFSNDEIFAIDMRKVLKATMFNHFELRCSYLQTNMSLREFTHKYNVEHKKLDDFKYSKKRYPWSKLTKKELDYMINDVLGLVEAIEEEMRIDGDNLYTIPMTSTGCVRRMAKRRMQSFNYNQLHNMLPSYEVYEMLSEAFRGGNTHANRYYADRIIENVSSADRSSSYPDCQVNDKYPMTEFYIEDKDVTLDWVLDLIYKYKKAVIFRVAFTNIRLKDDLRGVPYLSRDKSRSVLNGYYDNGRILSADYLETTLTDIDFKIILEEYIWDDCKPIKVANASYGYLPRQIRDLNKELYKNKTELKGVDGQDIYYMKSKNLLNSIYGMSVQRPVKQSIIYEDGYFKLDDKDEEEILLKNYRRAFMSYARGVWTTAHARYRLEEGIRLAGHRFVYCDTDSVKYTGDIDWTSYNQERIRISKKNGAYAKDSKGKMHYMGVFEQEETYPRFKTLGAKKYCGEDAEGHLHLTLAGVSKKLGAEELEERGGLESFKDGFIFIKGGGNEAKYNDNIDIKIKVDNHILEIKDNLYIKASVYTLGLTEEYIDLLNDAELWLEVLKKEML